MTKHETIHHPTQTALAERYADLLADIDLVADRANAARHDPQPHAAAIVEAAEVALVRVGHEWRKSRGGNQNNYFFQPLSQRLRRIIAAYREHDGSARAALPKPEDSARFVYKILDYEQIDFRRLAPWFRASAVDEAIRTGISLGLRELPGVRIYQEHPDE